MTDRGGGYREGDGGDDGGGYCCREDIRGWAGFEGVMH